MVVKRLLAGQDHLDLLDDFFLAQRVALEGEARQGLVEAVDGVFHVRQALAVLRRQGLVKGVLSPKLRNFWNYYNSIGYSKFG